MPRLASASNTHTSPHQRARNLLVHLFFALSILRTQGKRKSQNKCWIPLTRLTIHSLSVPFHFYQFSVAFQTFFSFTCTTTKAANGTRRSGCDGQLRVSSAVKLGLGVWVVV